VIVQDKKISLWNTVVKQGPRFPLKAELKPDLTFEDKLKTMSNNHEHMMSRLVYKGDWYRLKRTQLSKETKNSWLRGNNLIKWFDVSADSRYYSTVYKINKKTKKKNKGE